MWAAEVLRGVLFIRSWSAGREDSDADYLGKCAFEDKSGGSESLLFVEVEVSIPSVDPDMDSRGFEGRSS